jgi:outer membrane protein assembly factor BamB
MSTKMVADLTRREPMKRTLFCIFAAACYGAIALTAEADWLQFRGPGGSGIAPDKGVPVTWSDDSNIRWKAEMPGPGASSPIVVGNKVFVTCYRGYGLTRDNPGEQKNLKRHLVCLERQTGKTAWKRDIDPVLPESAFQGPYITMHGYASATPVSDGKHVFVFFGSAGVFAFDLDGQQLWHASVGKGTHGWGSGASPILHKDLLIVNASVESGSVLALDKKSGTEVWSTKGISGSWNTPVLVKLAGSAAELALATQPKMLGFDPDTGKELWRAETYDWYVCPSLIAHDGVLYGLQHSICVAVKAGGRGDVTDSHVLWKKNFGHVVSSPLYHDGHVYWSSRGTVYCVKASDGSVVYKERLKGADETYASPVLADDKIYFVTRSDGVYVVEAGPTFKLLARNTFKSDTSIFNASPAVSNSQLFLRSDRYLYCIGKEK